MRQFIYSNPIIKHLYCNSKTFYKPAAEIKTDSSSIIQNIIFSQKPGVYKFQRPFVAAAVKFKIELKKYKKVENMEVGSYFGIFTIN